MYERVTLLPVETVDVTVVVDNDAGIILPDTAIVKRPPLRYDWFRHNQLRAEPGYALLVTVARGGRRASMLYDAGLGRDTTVHNLDVLEIQVDDVQTLALSHGHIGHHGGLEQVLRRIGRPDIQLVLHPDVWLERRVILATGEEVLLPPPRYQDLQRVGASIVEERSPTLLLNGTLLTTGQIERVTDFEQGMAGHQARAASGDWKPDPWIWDDQAVVCHLNERGLVVLSTCSHAGIINTVDYARRLTGVNTVFALIGGLHLSGADFASNILPTIAALRAIAPVVLMPGHCTGWQVIHQLAREFSDAYVQSSVGTQLHLT